MNILLPQLTVGHHDLLKKSENYNGHGFQSHIKYQHCPVRFLRVALHPVSLGRGLAQAS